MKGLEKKFVRNDKIHEKAPRPHANAPDFYASLGRQKTAGPTPPKNVYSFSHPTTL